jgi:hypothetical protein
MMDGLDIDSPHAYDGSGSRDQSPGEEECPHIPGDWDKPLNGVLDSLDSGLIHIG